MLKLQRHNSSPPSAGSALTIAVDDAVRAVLDKLGTRWQCGPEIAAQRLIVLGLTGWRPGFAGVLDRLSWFVSGDGDPLRQTCLMLRHHFDKAELELGEPIKDTDRAAWLETLLDELKERRANGKPARLEDLLADGALLAAE